MDHNTNQTSLEKYGTLIKGSSKKAKISIETHKVGTKSQKKSAQRKQWQGEWLDQFKPWLIYDDKKVRLFCAYCMHYPHAKCSYSKKGSKNFKMSNLISHAQTQSHRDARNAHVFGKASMQKGLQKMQNIQEESLHNLFKLIAFGSDGCSTMIGKKQGIATLLKKVNPMLTSIHCVAHRTNLAISNMSKKIDYSKKIDMLINSIANHFSSSSNRMQNLRDLQEEFDCEILKMQRIFEIRWLSHHNCIKNVCKSLDALHFALEKERRDLYDFLSTFECIYALHYLADILEKITDLSFMFQRDYVDVTIVHGLVSSTILCIRDEFLDEREIDLNAAQQGIGEFPIIPEYGVKNGYMYAFRSSMKGDMFFGQKVKKDIEGADLQTALDFQFNYAKKLCQSLKKHFVDNCIMHAVKILVPTQHPLHERLLKEYGKIECIKIVDFYGNAKLLENVLIVPIIDGETFKTEFRKFKHHAKVDFAKTSLIEVASMLENNSIWKYAYPNILKVIQIALVQCCNIAICERGFSARTHIKSKWRNRLDIESLDALMTIVIEGKEDYDFSNAMELWKAETNRNLVTQGVLTNLHLDLDIQVIAYR
ncbi:hypothetical protein KP509_17G078700 [Ceratopteris richardii]|uniref:C17orf113 probable zinc finger domain-containing protein n=1 Tax=Ceratopteris richardii TaxID=49495 RepID=A0A8T2SX42_CERRI|nr:hypothetical protein KP509_17G078700 [Ceratopteris richardii]